MNKSGRQIAFKKSETEHGYSSERASVFAFSKEISHSLKGLLAIVIVCSHLHYATDIFFFTIANKLGTSAVAMFIFISGYGLSFSFKEKGPLYLNGFFRKRMWVVFKPMFIITLLFIGLNYLDKGVLPLNLFKNLFLGGITPLPNSWFVFFLLLFYLFFYVPFRFCKTYFSRILLLSAFSCAYVLLCMTMHFERAWWITTAAFVSGVVYAYKKEELLSFFRRKTVFASVCFLIIVVIYSKVVVLLLFPYLFIPILIITILSYTGFPANNKILIFLGNISYEIYLLHGVFIVLLRGKHIYIHSDYVYAVAVFVATILGSVMFRFLTHSQNIGFGKSFNLNKTKT